MASKTAAIAHTERAHAKLSPSSSKRWINCPGSINLEEGIPDTTSAYAAEGVAAHELSEHCLNHGYNAKRFIDTVFKGQKITKDFAENVQVYLDWCREQIAQAGPNPRYLVEEKVHISMIGDTGTADLIVYRPSDKTLIVGDLKFGRGIAVDAIDNTQGLLYALGAIKRFSDVKIDTVQVTIIQPRAMHPDGSIRTWEIDYEVLMDWTFMLMEAVKATKQKDAPLKAGDWCQFCKAAPICPELQKNALSSAMADFAPTGELVLSEPKTISPQRLAKALHDVKVIEIWCKRLKEYAYAEALAGRTPPGFKVVATRANRSWKDGAELELKLAGVENEDLYEEPSLRSVAQLEKTLGKKEFKQFEELVEKKSSGTVLAPLSDPRAAIIPDAQTQFSVIEEE